MDKKERGFVGSDTQCQKCKKPIGGQSYYILPLDCMYDGTELSKCKPVVLCSQCNTLLKNWLKS